jgi:hypothetical protein
VLRRPPIPPAPIRDTDTSWRQFVRTQAETMLACDVFRVDCPVTLRPVYVLVTSGEPWELEGSLMEKS